MMSRYDHPKPVGLAEHFLPGYRFGLMLTGYQHTPRRNLLTQPGNPIQGTRFSYNQQGEDDILVIEGSITVSF
ncbi:hypothetical protein JYU14_03690 [Simkania negevensis]|uniref:Uncharacterized protein n=1 Tax=Simkania negevensis TaxID=83561 RepID=A0ABS3ARZ8_9BACT|nr:hypothetical protein [Simkania negevensis]